VTPPAPDESDLAWYRANRDRIVAALPLVIGPATYTERFPECLDAWLAIDLTPAMTDAYILRPLRQVRAALEQS
jgi:hypothetical protein